MANNVTDVIDPEDLEVSKAVTDAAERCLTLLRGALQMYWEIGRLVSNLDREYGNSAIAKFRSQLCERIGQHAEFSNSTLYRAAQFFNKFSEDQFNKLLTSGVSWTQVVKTLPNDVTVVEPVIDRIIAGELKPHQLHDAVLAHEDNTVLDSATGSYEDEDIPDEPENDTSSPERAEREEKDEFAIPEMPEEDAATPKSIRSTLNRVATPLSVTIDSLPELIIAVDDISKLTKEGKEELSDKIDEVKRLVHNLVETAQGLKQRLNKI